MCCLTPGRPLGLVREHLGLRLARATRHSQAGSRPSPRRITAHSPSAVPTRCSVALRSPARSTAWTGSGPVRLDSTSGERWGSPASPDAGSGRPPFTSPRDRRSRVKVTGATAGSGVVGAPTPGCGCRQGPRRGNRFRVGEPEATGSACGTNCLANGRAEPIASGRAGAAPPAPPLRTTRTGPPTAADGEVSRRRCGGGPPPARRRPAASA
jgi:hypothetical protein